MIVVNCIFPAFKIVMNRATDGPSVLYAMRNACVIEITRKCNVIKS